MKQDRNSVSIQENKDKKNNQSGSRRDKNRLLNGIYYYYHYIMCCHTLPDTQAATGQKCQHAAISSAGSGINHLAGPCCSDRDGWWLVQSVRNTPSCLHHREERSAEHGMQNDRNLISNTTFSWQFYSFFLPLHPEWEGRIYTTWSNVRGHLLLEHLIPKSWVLIWSWSPLCCYNSLPFWEGYPIDVGALQQGLASIQPQEH